MRVFGTIAKADRLLNSLSGNPRWRIHFTDGRTFLTKTDADVNHGLTNYLPNEKGFLDVRMVLDEKGAVTGITAESVRYHI